MRCGRVAVRRPDVDRVRLVLVPDREHAPCLRVVRGEERGDAAEGVRGSTGLVHAAEQRVQLAQGGSGYEQRSDARSEGAPRGISEGWGDGSLLDSRESRPYAFRAVLPRPVWLRRDGQLEVLPKGRELVPRRLEDLAAELDHEAAF